MKKSTDKKDHGFIAVLLICLSAFSFIGWYTAETDNEILRKELSYYTGEEIRK